jgi:glucose/arabinose dehydrogenase
VMGPLMAQAVDDLGINKISIGISSGVENPSEACQVQYLNRQITEGEYVSNCAYNSVNDNADPFTVNPNGFHFPILDYQIDNLLLPLKQHLQLRGERLYVQLRYVDFGSSPYEHYQNPEEYAELMQVAFDHINSKYGFVPDGVDVMNEADQVVGWDATTLGRVIARSGARLAAVGFRPDFIGPSSVNKAAAVPYFDGMMAVPGAAQFLKDLSWHCYSDTGSNTSAAIGAKAAQYGVRTSMSECWTPFNTYLVLHQELKTSQNASWGLGVINGANGYYDVNTATGQATLRPKARFIRQYYKYIRAGARRIDATTTNPTFDPVAFINTDGKYVVVVKATGGGTFSIGSLPAGTYGTFYTTGPDGLTVSNFDVNGPDQTLAAGQNLAASIPASGVITVYTKTPARASAQNSQEPSTRGEASDRVQSPIAAATSAPATATTRDGIQLRFEAIADVEEPADAAFAPDGRLFVIERGGNMRVVRDGHLLEDAPPTLSAIGEPGETFNALAVDPQFSRTHNVYTISTTQAGSSARAFRLSRLREAANTFADRAILSDRLATTWRTPAASLRFGPDGKLFVALDDGGTDELAGDLSSANGKILRLNPDATTPDDQPGANPLFSLTFHSPHGLDWHPSGRTLWIADRDRGGSTRLRVIPASDVRREARLALSLPSGSAVSAIAFYRNGAIDALRDTLFAASDDGRALLRLRIDRETSSEVVATERLFQDAFGAIRTLTVGPDGAIYLGTATRLGRLVPDVLTPERPLR